MAARGIRLVDSSIGADKPAASLRNQDATIHFDNAPGLPQDQLDQARIFAPFRCPGLSKRRRFDLTQINNRAFGLGDNLLCHGEDYSRIQPLLLTLRRLADEGRQIIAGPHFRQRGERGYFNAHAVRRNPATRTCGARSNSSATSSGVSISNISPGRRRTSTGTPFAPAWSK